MSQRQRKRVTKIILFFEDGEQEEFNVGANYKTRPNYIAIGGRAVEKWIEHAVLWITDYEYADAKKPEPTTPTVRTNNRTTLDYDQYSKQRATATESARKPGEAKKIVPEGTSS